MILVRFSARQHIAT